MAKSLRACIDGKGNLFFVNNATGGYGVRVMLPHHAQEHLLSLINSRLLVFRLRHTANQFRGGYLAVNKQALERLPIRTIDFDDPADVARHDRMVALVGRMLELHKKLAAATIPADKVLYERQIEATDREIDAVVYELYELTDEEIAIVEGRI